MSDLLQDFTNALDCCGTCAGGVLARHTEAAVNEALNEAADAIEMSMYDDAARIVRSHRTT